MVLTGTLTFSEFTFNFVFDENKLRIIPITDENKVILFGWKKEKNANEAELRMNRGDVEKNTALILP